MKLYIPLLIFSTSFIIALPSGNKLIQRRKSLNGFAYPEIREPRVGQIRADEDRKMALARMGCCCTILILANVLKYKFD